MQNVKSSQDNLRKMNKVERYILPDCKTYKALKIETV